MPDPSIITLSSQNGPECAGFQRICPGFKKYKNNVNRYLTIYTDVAQGQTI